MKSTLKYITMYMMIDLIRRTNGDALGVLLFVVLIVYFSSRDRHLAEWLLLCACSVALLVDASTVLRSWNKKNV